MRRALIAALAVLLLLPALDFVSTVRAGLSGGVQGLLYQLQTRFDAATGVGLPGRLESACATTGKCGFLATRNSALLDSDDLAPAKSLIAPDREGRWWTTNRGAEKSPISAPLATILYPFGPPASEDTRWISALMADVSTPSSVFIAAPFAGTIRRFKTVLQGAITVADAAVGIELGGVDVAVCQLVIATAGSAAGVVDAGTATGANGVAEGDAVEIDSDGGSTTAAGLLCMVEFVPSA